MSVVSLDSYRKPKPVVLPLIVDLDADVKDFMYNTFRAWCMSRGVDTESRDYIYSAGAIMTIMQGMVNED
jgi:hypothetical protein